MTHFLDKIGLNYFWLKIKQTFPTRNEILDSEEAVSAALNDLNTRIPENISEFITGSDLKTINGQLITGNGDISINFYGESSTPAATVLKEVSIPSITTLNVGQFIIVKPIITSTVANSTIKLNSFDAYPMRYNNAAITTSTDSVVWNASYPSIFVFDGSYWVFAGHGLDSNTTYSGMTLAEATAGTATANRVISAKVLNNTIDGKLPLVTTTTNGLMSSLDKAKLDDIEVDYSKQYLTFVALKDGTFSFSGSGISYSVDGGATWTELTSNTASPTVTAGNKIMWKGTITPSYGIGTFSSTAKFDVEGNVMSLLFGDNFKGKTDLKGKTYAFGNLFKSNANLVSAENLSLPATTLASSCYRDMFDGCTNLTTVPSVLPAITLMSNCYQNMFDGCTNLTTAPELPATKLQPYCYNSMFRGCTKLNYIKAMFTTEPNNAYTGNWVSNVASTGTFVKNAAATWDVTGNNGIPSGWTVYTESEWEYAHKYELKAKQDTLVSGTNIKTINNQSLLGSGNITIEGGSGGGQTNVIESVKVNGTALTPDANKAVDITVPKKTSELTNDSGFLTDNIETTYANLVALRDNSELIPGQRYRITDYMTTVNSYAEPFARSAGHTFDIIITAADVNKFSEDAKAVRHVGDTYFSNSQLEAWELKYRLDNVQWSKVAGTASGVEEVTEAGKGTITWMKDEHGNECPYDFKNVQFKRWKVTDSMEGRTGFTDTYLGVPDNTAEKLSVEDAEDFIWAYTFSSDAMGGEQTDYSLVGSHSVYGNIIKEMGDGSLPDNVFFGENCYANTLSQDCYRNSFSQNCQYNSFSQNCYKNSFSQDCYRNSFSQDCSINSFSQFCQYNSFSQNCSYNSFSQNCQNNSFSQNCYKNSFSQDCQNNIFSQSCSRNSFSQDCQNNIFSQSCSRNSFSQDCSYNSFSQKVQYVKLSSNYMQQVIVESGNQHLNVVCNQSTSSSRPCRNIKIEQGVGNTTSEKTVTITTRNQNYQTVVKNANSVEMTA